MAQNDWAVVSEAPLTGPASSGWEVVSQKPTTGAFAAGVKSYLPQVQETFGGLKTLLGVGAERVLGEGQISRGLIESGAASMKEAEAKRQPFMTAERGSFTDALDKGVGAVLTEWLPYQAGSGAMQLLESLGLMGAGAIAGSALPGAGTLAGAGTGLVARELAKKGVKEAAEKILKENGEDAAQAYFENEAKKAARKIGGTAAIGAQAAFYGTGQTTSRAVEEAEKLGGTATDIELARVLPAAAVSTVAEFIGDKIALGALKGIKPGEPGKFVAADLAKNILLNIGLTGTKEVPVEVIQSAAERFGAKLSLTDAQALKEYIDATAASYGMAVAPGVGGGVRQTMAERAKKPEAPAQVAPPAPAAPVAETPVTPEVTPPIAPEAPPVAAPPVQPPAAETPTVETPVEPTATPVAEVPAVETPVTPVAETPAAVGSPDAPAAPEVEPPAKAIDIDRAWRDLSGRNKLSDFDEKAPTDVSGDPEEFVLSRAQGDQYVSLAVREQTRDDGEKVFSSSLETGGKGFPTGTGAATTMYLEALNVAKNRNIGWMSEGIRSDQSKAIYERLKKAGVPFIEDGNASYIDANSLAAVNLQEVANKLAQQQKKTTTPSAPTAVTPETTAPTVETTPAAVTQPQTQEEFNERMPPVFFNTAVSDANQEGNFAKLTKALQRSANPAIRRIGQLAGGIASQITLKKPKFLGKRTAGLYTYDDDAIQMSPSHAGNELTNAHETLHALISKAQRFPTDRQKPVVEKIEFLYEHVKKELRKKGIVYTKNNVTSKNYGLKNVREFTAEAMTNPEFQFLLMQIPYPGKKTAWTQFVKLAADLLGIQNTNALTEVMNLVDRLAMQKQPRKTVTDKGLTDEMTERPPELDTSGLAKVIKGRDPQLQAAAQQLKEGKITREQYEQYVNYYTPIEAVEADKLRPPSTEEAMRGAVASNKANLVNQQIADGAKVGLRLDIPSTRAGVPTVSVHEGASGKASQGKAKSYTSTAHITNATFETRSQKAGLEIAVGAGKEPLQTVEGTWVNEDPQSVFEKVKGFLRSPDWVQVGFDPTRHGYFYDRKKGDPVASASEVYQIGTLLVAKDVKYAPKENYLYSVEPTIKSDRVPSYKRGVENLRKRWEKGDLTSDEFAARVDILAKQVEMAELAKEKTGRERGADFLRQKLLEAKRRGELSPEAVDFAEWFILQNPALVDDLGISIRTPKEDGLGGMYDSYSRVMYLMKESGSDTTAVHEILHHLERMMPKEVQSAIRKTWIKSLMEAQKNAKTDAEKQFFKNLTDFHFGFGSRSLLKDAINAIKEGDVSKDLYQYTSPSEFWAENGSEIMKGRFDVKGSVLGRLKQWLSELKEKARALFGLENKAAIIRALDSLSKGDGKFVTSTLLDETNEPKFSITPMGAPGQQALETINRMGMGVKPPEPGKIAKLQKILKDAGENPAGTKASAKAALTKWLDWFETISFSGDAAFANKVQRSVIADMKENEEVLGKLLELSQSQAVNADNVVSRGLIEGSIEYNEEMKKWQSVKKDENFAALIGKLEELSKKYGTSTQEMERIAHAYLVAKRLPGIIKRNEELDAEIAAEEATAKPDRKSIDKWKSLKVYVSPEQEAMVDDGVSLGKTIPELSQISDMWNAIRKNNIAVMVESGLYTPEYAQQLWDNMDYVPYYREEQLEADAGPTEFIRGLQVKAKEFQLKGSGAAVNDVFENMMLWSQYAMNRAIRADKARRMIDVAKDIDIGDRKMAVQVKEEKRGMNIVRVFRDGKQELWDLADPMFVPAFTSIQNVSIPMFKWAAKVADVLRNSVVLYPMFSVAQVPQDSFAAMFTSGLKPQHALKIPILAVKEFIKTLNKTSATHNELVKYGVVGARNFSAEVMRQDAEIFAGLKPPKGGWNKTKDFLEHIAMSADNAVRQAVYEAAQQQGVSKQEALEKAFEIFNVRRRGTSKALNLAGQTIPFFYAYLAAQRVAYRTITGVGTSPTERKAALLTLASTSAAVFTLSMLYAMMVADDEDYADTPAPVRDRTLTIPGTGGVRIPLRPDFFLFPKIIAEHTYLMLTDQGYEDGAKFRRSMRDGLVNAIASPTPLPQIAKPSLEVAINYSFFDGKPVVGTFEKQKDLERQFNDSTSEFSKLLGKTGFVSPIAADHLIRGMLGSAGGLALYGTNFVLHSDPDVPRPELSWKEAAAALPGTSGFLKRPQESALKNDFYTLRDEVEKAVNTFNDIKTRSPQGMEDFLEDEKKMARYMLGKPVDQINQRLSKIRRQITIITNMPESQMSAEDKSDNIRQLREVEREILKSVDVKALREMAKI